MTPLMHASVVGQVPLHVQLVTLRTKSDLFDRINAEGSDFTFHPCFSQKRGRFWSHKNSWSSMQTFAWKPQYAFIVNRPKLPHSSEHAHGLVRQLTKKERQRLRMPPSMILPGPRDVQVPHLNSRSAVCDHSGQDGASAEEAEDLGYVPNSREGAGDA